MLTADQVAPGGPHGQTCPHKKRPAKTGRFIKWCRRQESNSDDLGHENIGIIEYQIPIEVLN